MRTNTSLAAALDLPTHLLTTHPCTLYIPFPMFVPNQLPKSQQQLPQPFPYLSYRGVKKNCLERFSGLLSRLRRFTNYDLSVGSWGGNSPGGLLILLRGGSSASFKVSLPRSLVYSYTCNVLATELQNV